jgi:hypothetical protein
VFDYLRGDFHIDCLEDKGGFAKLTKEQGKDPDKGVFLDIVRSAQRPRIIKTHLSFPFINETALSKAKVRQYFMKSNSIAGVKQYLLLISILVNNKGHL